MSVSTTRAQRVFTFGPYRLDSNERHLVCGDTAIRMSPKDFDILLLLVENAGHLVDKSEIRTRIWPGTSVDDNNLAQHISALRKALGDSPRMPYIETLPRVGYRFVAEVHAVQPAQSQVDFHNIASAGERSLQAEIGPAAKTPLLLSFVPKTRGWNPRVLASVVVVATLLAGLPALIDRRDRPIQSIAVLPLANLSGDPSQDYFAEGMTDALITNLSKIGSLRVISGGSVMQYRNTAKPAAEIGRLLRVDAVVEGAVVRSGNRVRITAQLIRTPSDQNIWADEYDRDYQDIIALQNDVVSEIAARIRIQLTRAEKGRLSGGRRVNPEAQNAYLKGRYFWNRRTESDYLNAIRWFEEAMGYDPNYAVAYAGLADSYALLGSMPNSEIARSIAMPRAKAAAEKALELDPSLADAHTSLAFVKMHYEWDFQGAEREFRRAIELNPNYATAHHWYAYELIATNRINEALAEIERARSLDPLSSIINTDLAEAYFWADRFDDALSQAQTAMALDPSFPLVHTMLERIYIAKHMFPEAIREAEQVLRLAPADRWSHSGLAVALAHSGRREEAQKILKDLELQFVANGARDDLALVYAALGDRDLMFAELEKLYSNRDGGLIMLNYEESWRPYRTDPKFQNLVRRVGLPAK